MSRTGAGVGVVTASGGRGCRWCGVGVGGGVGVGVGVARSGWASPSRSARGVDVTVGAVGGLPFPPAAPLAPAAEATTSAATTTAVATIGGHDRRRAPSDRPARTPLAMAALRPPGAGGRLRDRPDPELPR